MTRITLSEDSLSTCFAIWLICCLVLVWLFKGLRRCRRPRPCTRAKFQVCGLVQGLGFSAVIMLCRPILVSNFWAGQVWDFRFQDSVGLLKGCRLLVVVAQTRPARPHSSESGKERWAAEREWKGIGAQKGGRRAGTVLNPENKDFLRSGKERFLRVLDPRQGGGKVTQKSLRRAQF